MLIPMTFNARVTSDTEFAMIYSPEGFLQETNSPNDVTIKNLNGDLTNCRQDIKLKYKTNTSTDRYVYQKNQKLSPGKVAVMCQFMPTFTEQKSQSSNSPILYTHDMNKFDDEIDQRLENEQIV